MTRPRVRIDYHRLPDRLQVFRQELVLDRPDVKVTFQPATPLEGPVQVDGGTILDAGAPVVWFTFPGRWHDIGRFHTANGTFTGLYANILTPPVLSPEHGGEHLWATTDLFLDVWLAADQGELRVLDRDQFDQARAAGWLDDATAGHALAETRRIRQDHSKGLWPPPVVAEWTLERIRRLS